MKKAQALVFCFSIFFLACGQELTDEKTFNLSGNTSSFVDEAITLDSKIPTGANKSGNVTSANDLALPLMNEPAALEELSSAESNKPIPVDPQNLEFLLNGSPNGTVKTIALQTDQKILIGGCFTQYHNLPAPHIARLLPNGSLDTTFQPANIGIQGFATPPWNYSSECFGETNVEAIAVQPDGKILLGGNFALYDMNFRNGIVRVNDNGTIDPSFDIGSGFAYSHDPNKTAVMSIVLLSSGKILVGGIFNSFNGNTSVRGVARLNADGSLDTTFSLGGNGPQLYMFPPPLKSNRTGYVRSIDINPSNGDIYVGGNFGRWNGDINRQLLVKLHEDGSLDQTFSPGINYINTPMNGVNKVLYSSARNSVLIARDVATSKIFSEVNPISGLALPDILDAVPQAVCYWTDTDPVFGKTLAILQNGHILGGSTDTISFQSTSGLLKTRMFATLTYINPLPGGISWNYGNLQKFPYTYDVGFISALTVQADGKVLVGGAFNKHFPYPMAHSLWAKNAINLARINPYDGRLAQ